MDAKTHLRRNTPNGMNITWCLIISVKRRSKGWEEEEMLSDKKCNKSSRGALIKTVISSLLLFRPVRCRVSLGKGRSGQALLGKDSLVQKKVTLEKEKGYPGKGFGGG